MFCSVDSTQIVRKAGCTTSATCSAALGRLLTGAALIGSMLRTTVINRRVWSARHRRGVGHCLHRR